MNKNLIFVILTFNFIFFNLSLGSENMNDEKNNFEKKGEKKKIDISFKLVENLNIVIKKSKDNIFEKVEVKGSGSKDTFVGVKIENSKIIAICDNYKW